MSLVERKREQWAKEKAEAAAATDWYPFGKPGGGAPPSRRRDGQENGTSVGGLRRSRFSSSDNLNTSRPTQLPSSVSNTSINGGINLPLNGHYQSPGAANGVVRQTTSMYASPLGQLQPSPTVGYPPPVQQPMRIVYAAASPQQQVHYVTAGGQPLGPGLPTTIIVGAASPHDGAPIGYMGMPQIHPQQLPATSSAYQLQPIGGPSVALLPQQQPSQGTIVRHGQLAPIHPESLCSVATTQRTSPPTQQTHLNAKNHRQSPPQTYTEQWANQLPFWQQDQIPIGSQVSVDTSFDGGQHQQHSPVRYVQQRTPKQHQPPAHLQPMALSHRQSTDSSGHGGGYYSSGVEGTPHDVGGYQHQQLDTSSSVSSLNAFGPRTRTRRRTTGGVYDEEQWEEREAKTEQLKVIDEQIAEKQRRQQMEAEQERREMARAERERREIELNLEREGDAERNRWRELQDDEDRREQAVAAAWEKARQEASLVKRAKVMKHVLDAPLDDENGDDNGTPVKYAPEFEKAREFVRKMDERTKLDRELIDNYAHRVRVQNGGGAVGNDSDAGTSSTTQASRSKSLPPVAPPRSNRPAVRASQIPQSTNNEPPQPLVDNRPIRPAQVDPLALWEQINNSAEDLEAVRSPKRNSPGRYSMRQPSNPSNRLSVARRARRTSSAERLAAQQQGEDTVSGSEPSVREDKSAAQQITVKEPVAPVRVRSKVREKTEARTVKDKSTADDSAPKTNGVVKRAGEMKRATTNGSAKPVDETKDDGGNPWGDSLGGLNPLFQPLKTRSRRKPPAPPPPAATTVPPEEVVVVTTAQPSSTTLPGAGSTTIPTKAVSARFPSSKTNDVEPVTPGRFTSTVEVVPSANDSPNQPAKSKTAKENEQNWRKPPRVPPNSAALTPSTEPKYYSDSKASPLSLARHRRSSGAGGSDVDLSSANNSSEDSTSPNVDRGIQRFNAKNPLYRSFNVKRPGSATSDRQKQILDQLASLRAQLKSKQKQVESSFSNGTSLNNTIPPTPNGRPTVVISVNGNS